MVTQIQRYASAERVGARIRALREQQGLSTTVLARKAGFSQQQICQVELGKINTPIETLARVADALGVELGELVSEDVGSLGEMPPDMLAQFRHLCRDGSEHIPWVLAVMNLFRLEKNTTRPA